jgi:cytochrome c peroxidase
MFGDRPVELGTRGSGEVLLAELAADAGYRELFETAFAGAARPISLHSVTHALAAFERALISADSAYDRYLEGRDDALGAAELRGLGLFSSERLGCSGCHAGFNLDASALDGGLEAFQNTALYAAAGQGADPESVGLVEFTGRAEDIGRFKIPSLRNIALTAPYMHDGSVATLDGVLDHYAGGGRQPDSPWKSSRLRGFSLAQDERADLLAFLHALTDEAFVREPCLGDPFVSASDDR